MAFQMITKKVPRQVIRPVSMPNSSDCFTGQVRKLRSNAIRKKETKAVITRGVKRKLERNQGYRVVGSFSNYTNTTPKKRIIANMASPDVQLLRSIRPESSTNLDVMDHVNGDVRNKPRDRSWRQKQFEEMVFNYQTVKKKYLNDLKRFKWFESSKKVEGEECCKHSLEIVCKFGKVPRIDDIAKLFGEENLPFITYEEFPKNDWFEENIFDEKSKMRETYKSKLSRLSWVKHFSIRFDRNKDKTWKIYITYYQEKEPCMEDLEKIFGDNIFCFVDLIQERVDDDKDSGFLRGPKSGDGVHNDVASGTIGILSAGVKSSKNHYATTCYHVCYNKELSGEFLKDHEKMKEDYDNGSPECVNVTYMYSNENGTESLGTFADGLYNDEHDIGLIKLNNLDCKDAINFLREEKLEEALLSEEEAGNKLREKLKEHGKVPVGKFGHVTNHTEGELVSIDGGPLENGINSAFYEIRRMRGKGNFAEKGDSGSLVYMICDGKKFPFAYVQGKHGGLYCCPNLKSGLEAMNISAVPCISTCSQ